MYNYLYINNETTFGNILLRALLYLIDAARARAMRYPHRRLVPHGTLGYGPTYPHPCKLIPEKHHFLDPFPGV